MDTSADRLVGQTVDGRYRIIAMLARGGMATVYEALDTRLDRVVALKIMHKGLAEDHGFVERFQREARAAARLSHPHVVAVFDQGEADGHVYLAMEYVPGRTLRDVLRQYGPLTSEQALTILDPVVEALAAAHAAGFVHRDIKPENVLISNDGRIKVADFGLARAVTSDGATTTQGLLIGTVAYLSPEQVEHGKADGRSDVYAAGILLYEMVTGKVPHTAENPLSVAYQHVNNDVPAPSLVNPAVPAEVDALVTTATRRDPQLRYQDAQAFLSDIRKVRTLLPAARPFADSRDTLIVDAAMVEEFAQQQPAASPAPVPAASPARTPRRKGPIVAAIVVIVAVALAAVGGFVAYKTFFGGVPIPNVVGMDVAKAESTATKAGFTVDVTGEEYSETVAKDVVIASDPEPGGNLAEGGTIGLTVSKGPERYNVPDVAGLSVAEATAAIEAAKLTVASATSEKYDDKVAAGLVAGTNPEAGTPSKPGTGVTVFISKGPKPVPIPDVIGESAKTVTKQLAAAGLKASVVGEEFSMKYPKGDVITVSPKVGTVVDSGSTVELVVSKGPPPVVVPNLVDMSKEQAISTLSNLGLKVDVNEGAFTPLNRVLSQSPVAGTKVPKGSTVSINII